MWCIWLGGVECGDDITIVEVSDCSCAVVACVCGRVVNTLLCWVVISLALTPALTQTQTNESLCVHMKVVRACAAGAPHRTASGRTLLQPLYPLHLLLCRPEFVLDR